MFQGFYLLTEDVVGEATCPDGWTGSVKSGTPLVMTYFDEYGMEFLAVVDEDGRSGCLQTTREFRLNKPCPIVAAASCPDCGKIVPTNELDFHFNDDVNCQRIRLSKVFKG